MKHRNCRAHGVTGQTCELPQPKPRIDLMHLGAAYKAECEEERKNRSALSLRTSALSLLHKRSGSRFQALITVIRLS